MSVFDWFRINNNYDFRLVNGFAQGEFFKFCITKDNYVRTDEFAVIPILLSFKPPINPKHENLNILQTEENFSLK